MNTGTRIDYKLRVRGLPLRWRTLITVWDPPHRFVDEQERGPYHRWHHEHRFTPMIRQGVMGTHCVDIVHHRAPGGDLIHRLFVGQEVRRIFEFRQKKLLQIFNPPT